jgi:hypothetical protein
MTPVEEAAQQGYTQEEVNGYLATKSQEAKAAGYSDEEIQTHIKREVLQQPDFNQTPVLSAGHRTLATMKSPATLMEAIKTGWGWSNIALAGEMLKGPDGKLPSLQVDESTPIALRAAANLTGTLADVPSMVAGGLIGGGPASPVTALGGAFALPMGLRSVFIDAIQSGEVGTRKEFAERVTGTMWETAKGWITGATVGKVGKAATAAVSALPGAAKAFLPTVAEIATMTEVSARLEGHAPTPESLIDNAIVLGVAKSVLPAWAAVRSPNVLHDTYVKTGIPPEQVVHDALREPAIWQDTLDGRIPDAYKDRVEHPVSVPTQAQRTTAFTKDVDIAVLKQSAAESLAQATRLTEATGKPSLIDQARQQTEAQRKPSKEKVLPPMTPEQQVQARAFLEQPFADIPQAPNEPSRPTHMNYSRITTTDEAKMALSQLSTLYEEKIAGTQQSPRSWEKSHQDAAKVLSDLLQSDPSTVSKFLKGEKAGPSTTAQLLARKELTLGFTEDLMRSRAALVAKGDAATPEELATFLSHVERVSNVQASFLGQRADIARALNALKSTKRDADRSQAILDAINTYGGPENVGMLVKLLGEYDNPAQAIAFAKKATKATTWEMLVEAWKAGLVSGLRTNEVNFLSTAAFTTLRLPIEAFTATLGALKRHEERVAFTEIPARIFGMTAGVRDGFKAAGAVLRTGDNIMGPKTDTFEPKIPGKTGEIIRLPFRALSASDVLLKTINERGELYSLATRQALSEGASIEQGTFFARVAELAANPPEAMADAAKDAALRYTFNKPLGTAGKSFQHLVKTAHLEWMFPFITTPGNIFKETARMTPGLNFAVKEWRKDYEAGGVRRDRAVAEVAVGSAIMSAVVAATLNGVITGNGTPDKGLRKTERAAGWKPYAVKLNGQYVDGYLRMAPIGPLIGLAADGAEFMNYMTNDERDQWARMLAFSFASNVTNQTFMTGATSFVNVLQDPSRYGQNYFESLSASLVPSIIGQTAADMDPLLREIHGIRDAMIARIPGQREGLMPQKDWTGQPIPSPERLWWGSPFSASAVSTDKVRMEAARIGFATPDIPKSLDVIPGKDFGKLDKVRLTPEQRDVFASEAGQMAYATLTSIVASPGWDQQPDIIKRQVYEKVMKQSRDMATKQALMGQDPAVTQQAVDAILGEINK